MKGQGHPSRSKVNNNKKSGALVDIVFLSNTSLVFLILRTLGFMFHNYITYRETFVISKNNLLVIIDFQSLFNDFSYMTKKIMIKICNVTTVIGSRCMHKVDTMKQFSHALLYHIDSNLYSDFLSDVVLTYK